MKRILYLLVGIAVAAGLTAWWLHSTAAPKEEGIAYLRPVKADFFSDITAHLASSVYGPHDTKPLELLDLPAGITEDSPGLRFYSLPVGKEKVFVLIQQLSDRSAKAWIDLNLNHRLSDENTLFGVPQKYIEDDSYTLQYFDFGTIHFAGNEAAASFYLGSYHEYVVRISPSLYMSGIIRLDGKIYHVAAIDGDYDGTYQTHFYGTESLWHWGCDGLALTPVKRGLFGRKPEGYVISRPLGRYYKIDERYYSVSISSDGKTLQMTPAQPAMGTLRIGSDKRLSGRLLSDAATQDVIFTDTISIPQGRYKIESAYLTFTDQNQQEWQLYAQFYNNPVKGNFEIAEGQTTTLTPGPPFTIKTDVVKRGDEQLSINAGLIGNEGEEYGLRIVRSAARPELKILAENGDTLHTGSMEYG